jgi:hypothetical protein
MRPIVPAKMMELRSLRDGIEVAKKYGSPAVSVGPVEAVTLP